MQLTNTLRRVAAAVPASACSLASAQDWQMNMPCAQHVCGNVHAGQPGFVLQMLHRPHTKP